MNPPKKTNHNAEVWHLPFKSLYKSWSGWLVCGIGLSLIAFVVVHQLKILNLDQTKVYSDWMQGFCAVSAMILGWRVTRHPKLDDEAKKAFWFLTLAYASFAFGALHWIFFNSLLGHYPYISLGESLADVGFLAMYPLMLLGLFKFPTHKTAAIGTKFGLDVAIVAFGVITILWHFVVFPSLDKIEDGQWFSTIFKLLYPFGDCCLLVGLFKLLKNQLKGTSSVALLIFGIGIAVLAFGDIGFNYLSLQRDYQPGHIIESAWFLSLFLFCLSSFYQYEQAFAESSAKPSQNWFNSDWITYFSVGIVSLILLTEAIPYLNTSIGFTVFVIFILTGLIMVRQMFALRENAELFSVQYKQKSELQFLSLIQNSTDLIFVFDNKGRFTYQSPSVTRILGYEEGYLLQHSALKYIHPQDIESMTKGFAQLLQNPEDIIQSECRVLKKDGSWVVLEGVVKFFADEETGKKGIVLNSRDVTERKDWENQIKEFNQRLQQSNRELNDFAHIASHDLQEPLRKIQTFGDRLKTKDAANLSIQGKDYLERMQNAANRMQKLITDLLGFSRLGRQSQSFEPTDLTQITQEVLSDLEVKIEDTKAEIIVKDLPVIDAEPTQMRQLIQNLVSNALKFQQPNQLPKVEIYTESSSRKNFCQIVVKDNGIGFDEKSVDKIFAVFQRLHGRTQYEGSGVGLAVCRKIAEKHNGQITAESAPGNGAKFIVTLPVKQGSCAEM